MRIRKRNVLGPPRRPTRAHVLPRLLLRQRVLSTLYLHVDELTERNIEIVSKLEDAAREQGKPTDRIAAAIARFCGSMTFVWVHVVWFAS